MFFFAKGFPLLPLSGFPVQVSKVAVTTVNGVATAAQASCEIRANRKSHSGIQKTTSNLDIFESVVSEGPLIPS